MKYFKVVAVVMLFVLSTSFLIACGSGGDEENGNYLYPISWNRVEHYYGDNNHFLTITELLGPKNASIDNIIPGTYIARGTYDLKESSFTTGKISLGFLGTITTGMNGQTSEEKNFIIPDGELSGEYEVIQGFLQLTDGPGNPTVSFVVGSTMHDEIILY